MWRINEGHRTEIVEPLAQNVGMTEDDKWQAAIAAYQAAGVEHASASALIAERLSAGETPTEAEFLREQDAHTNAIEARRAIFFLFAARTRAPDKPWRRDFPE